VADNTKRSKAWPKAANKLSNRLKRAATFLRTIGIDVETGGWSKTKGREIKIRWIPESRHSTVGTVETVESEELRCLTFYNTSHDTGFPHGRNNISPDITSEPWGERAIEDEVFHDTHDTHDTHDSLHTPAGEMEEWEV
jgi:hypothetical protein